MKDIIIIGSKIDTFKVSNPQYPLVIQGNTIETEPNSWFCFGPDGRGHYAHDYIAVIDDGKFELLGKKNYYHYMMNLIGFLKRINKTSEIPQTKNPTMGWGFTSKVEGSLLMNEADVVKCCKKMDFIVVDTKGDYKYLTNISTGKKAELRKMTDIEYNDIQCHKIIS